nr:unnamed protein product [Callosobruchus chinensis]
MFIFPREKFQDHFIRDGPTGSVGTANGSGWMHVDDFHVFLHHFVHHTPTFYPVKLLIVFQKIQCQTKVLVSQKCRKKKTAGSPNTSVNVAEEEDVATGEYLKSIAATSDKTVEVPVKERIEVNEQTTPAASPSALSKHADEPNASTSTAGSSFATTSSVFSPEALRPLPKAPPRKGNQWNRRDLKSAVLTDTSVKDEIAAIEAGKKVKSIKKRIFVDEKPKKEKQRS